MHYVTKKRLPFKPYIQNERLELEEKKDDIIFSLNELNPEDELIRLQYKPVDEESSDSDISENDLDNFLTELGQIKQELDL